MKLNKEGKNELREKIAELLQRVPEGEKIRLEKQLLEELLFDEIVCNKETGEKVKLPIWSGEFLSKIDLSDVSFKNVAWSLLIEEERDTCFDEIFDEETWHKFNVDRIYSLKDNAKVNYSNTNAKIDFSESWESRHGSFDIICCDFSGVDLSNNDMSKVGSIYNSDLSNTKILLTPEILGDLKRERFGEVNFSGVDLSKFTFNLQDLVSGFGRCIFDDRCDLSNTGLKLEVQPDDMDTIYKKDSFKKMLANEYLNGCYVNGIKILSLEEKKSLAEVRKSEYEQMKSDILDSVNSSIEAKIKK